MRAPESLNSDRLVINHALDRVLPLDLRERLILIPQSRLFFPAWRLSPDRPIFGLKVPALHFTQHCVLWIGQGAAHFNTRLTTLRHTMKVTLWSILDEGSYQKMTSCHWIHSNAKPNYWNHLSSGGLFPWAISSAASYIAGDWVPTLVYVK